MVRRRSPRRATTSRRSGIFLAVLLAAAWAASVWWPEGLTPAAAVDARPKHAGIARPRLALDAPRPAAGERGEFGFAPLLAAALADRRLSIATGEFAGPGMTAAEFRSLYEDDPGDGARFMFGRRAPRAD